MIMSKFIGRKQEVEELNSLYNSGKAEFVAVYGRRRVGKTFLVKETFQNKLTFYHSGLSPFDKKRKIGMKDQIEAFYASLLQFGMEEGHCPDSWMEAFAMLGRFLDAIDKGSRQLIFIDELPWMDTPRSKFMVALEHFWNSWCAWHDRVMLVVCGSATSWMLDNLINNKGGLYDRLTWQIKLSPFTLGECRDYFASKAIAMSSYDLMEAYMILGGIPYYLNYFQKGKSLAQNVDLLFFEKNAKLEMEFQRLFGSLFANPDEYKAVIKLLAQKHIGYTREEIAQNLGLKAGGSFSKMLDVLIASDFVKSYYPFGEGKRERKYKLTDSFCQFYLTFIEDKEISDVSFWHHNQNTPRINTWRGFAFEQVCFNHVAQIKKALGVENVISNESAWIVKGDEANIGMQTDMLIVRDDRVVNLCEMKFLSKEYEPTNDDEFKYRARIAALQEKLSPKQTIHLTLVTSFGLRRNAHSGIFQQTVTIDDIIG
jgi:hypothetical protein